MISSPGALEGDHRRLPLGGRELSSVEMEREEVFLGAVLRGRKLFIEASLTISSVPPVDCDPMLPGYR